MFGGPSSEPRTANTDPAARVNLPSDHQIFDESTFAGAFFQLLEQTGLLHRASELVGPTLSEASTRSLEQFPARVEALLQQHVFHGANESDRETLISQFINRNHELINRLAVSFCCCFLIFPN